MFKLNRSTAEAGDGTSYYGVVLYTTRTVGEFVQQVLTERSSEWGRFGIKEKGVAFDTNTCEYKNGELTTQQFTDDILNQKIESVSAHGGWTNMDYSIILATTGLMICGDMRCVVCGSKLLSTGECSDVNCRPEQVKSK